MVEPKKRKSAIQNGDNPQKRQKSQQSSTKISKERRRISADSLRWRKAKLPDMFDDAEGFCGLEEVDDIEIFRRDDNTVEFVRSTLMISK